MLMRGTIDECKPVQHVCPIMRAKENLKQLFHGVKTRSFGAVISSFRVKVCFPRAFVEI